VPWLELKSTVIAVTGVDVPVCRRLSPLCEDDPSRNQGRPVGGRGKRETPIARAAAPERAIVRYCLRGRLDDAQLILVQNVHPSVSFFSTKSHH